MPAIPTNASAAPKPTLMEADFEGLNLNSGENHNADKEHTLGVQGAHQKRKRYRDKGRRSRKGKEAAVEDVSSNTADEVTEAGNVSEAEPEGEDHAPTSYSLSDTETVATEPLPRFRPLPQLPTGSFIQVPILARYELRDSSHDTDGEDDIDQGLFATQNIEQGTRIISERPLFTLPAPGDQLSELMEAHNNLSKPEQNRVWNLRPAAPEASDQLRNLRFLTDRLASDLQNIFLKPEGTRTNKEKATLQKMQPKLENAANVWRIAARWHANRCAMTDLPEDQRSGLPKGTPITGLFIERAQIRHSCVPNCFASYDPNFGRMNVHVTRDIATGEELTLSAFADNMYYKDAEDRGKELAAWGLTCDCEACAEGDAKFEMHQAARQRAHTRVVMLLDYLTRLEKEEFSEDELLEGQDLVLAIIRDLKATGCESVETVRWRNVLVDRILPARALVIPDNDKLLAWQLILRHSMECEKVGGICYGEDREEFRVLRQTREATQAWDELAIAHEESRIKDFTDSEDGEDGE